MGKLSLCLSTMPQMCIDHLNRGEVPHRVLQYNAEVVLVWQFRILEHGTKPCVTEHHTMNVYPGHAHTQTHTYLFLTSVQSTTKCI